MSTYQNYLNSIISRATDALAHYEANELTELANAVGDIEDDARHMLDKINTDADVIAAFEAETTSWRK